MASSHKLAQFVSRYVVCLHQLRYSARKQTDKMRVLQLPTSNSAAQVSTRLYDGTTPSAFLRARTAIMLWPVRRPTCESLKPRDLSSCISSADRLDRFCSRSQHSAVQTQHKGPSQDQTN